MKKNRMLTEYGLEVEMFIEQGVRNSKIPNVMSCPCLKCVNEKTLNVNIVRDHLFLNGIDQSYQTWIFHSESLSIKRNNENVSTSAREEEEDNE